MRTIKDFIMLGTLILLAVTFGCGGSGDGGGSTTGTVSMSITDAKPVLPDNVTNCFIEIDGVQVHSSKGGWETLDLPDTPGPYIIDLLQFTEGNRRELVPPVALGAGKYTQVRLSVVSAWIWFNEDPTSKVDLIIPSENLKTDKNFDFTVGGTAVDITIDFDLSKSLVLEGPDYKLKPVLHIIETTKAATIEGFVANERFVGNYIVITVFDSNKQEYTNVKVVKKLKDADGNPLNETPYEIFWLVPNQAYTVKICHNPEIDADTTTDGIQFQYNETVDVPSVQPGDRYGLDFPPIP